jgi:hypothetical protein
MKRWLICLVAVGALGVFPLRSVAAASPELVVKPLAERRIAEIPVGELYWRIENFPTVAKAQEVASPWSLVVEAAGKVWMFTLGPSGLVTPGAAKVADVGPIPRIQAVEYLLRINLASGPPGSMTQVHTHPGSEAFFVLQGEQSIRSAHGVQVVKAGEVEPGHAPGMSMQVSSSGGTDLQALVMFVVDANKPFSSPATLP